MPSRSPKRTVNVRVFPPFRSAVKTPVVRKAATTALAVADPEGATDLSVVIADDETLRELNRRYRGFDEPTDVLSFGDVSDASLTPPDADGGPVFPAMPGGSASLGEIVLSYPFAVRQAGEHNVRVEEEVALLIVHGVLHLLGHDHAEVNEETAMKEIEGRALDDLFPERVAEAGGAR